ncbi:histone acetyltransferase MCC1-like isoform X2 [Iris pallida]|uniref:N-alpha-acetyltransferase 60 n=1 Tax=Iris pallida TaxID=29817 RepID=A0AAX6FQ03_IRIPA|nr:histone acetyltransferase MCC1-like isoform X2 [Iris pallida]KAJ6823298.1 histone acetyltransferase MCC1-like isoform X2 [Iris pallida]
MLDIKSPTIIYRPIRPSDLEVLEQIHASLFPVRYERDFFLNVVTGQGIISWAAVDISRLDGHGDELIGFVTTRVIAAKDSEIEDLIRYDVPRKDQTLVYILTLGVVEHYRNLGVATSLVREVINYASSITNCQAVYLHVISYNNPAIHFYKKMLFKLIRRLPRFYYINGQHYDSYLFVYYVNGAQSPCSPLHIVGAIAAYIRALYRSLYTKIWKNEKQLPRWSKGKENISLLVTHNSRIVGSDSSLREV